MKLNIDAGIDERVRNNLNIIEQDWNENPIANGTWAFFEKSLVSMSYPATFTITHRLGFIPKDVIQTSLTGNGVVTYNYENFTKDSFELSITDAVVVRFLIGKM